MKTARLLSLALSCALLAPSTFAATDVVAGWYAELSDIQQSSHQSDGGRLRATTVLRAAVNASSKGLPNEVPPAGANLNVAAAHAAYSVLAVLYPQSLSSLDAQLAESLAGIADSATAIAAGKAWGEHVAQVVLADASDTVFLNPRTFAATAETAESSSSVSVRPAEQTPPGSGRYRFSVLAGTPGTLGYVDSSGAAARFDNPGGIAVDAAGNVYVSELVMCTIRKITPEGVVSTFAGTAGQPGSQDGAGAAARFNCPYGLAVDGAGNVYVADMLNHTVRKIDPAGNVTTLAGKAGEFGRVNGAKGTARFDSPAMIAVDDAGNVFVTERLPTAFSPGFCRITPDGNVSRPVTSAQIDPFMASWGASYRDSSAYEIAADHAGNIYTINSDFFFSFVDVVKLTPNAAGGYEGKSLGMLTTEWDGKSLDPLKSNWDWRVLGFGIDGQNNLYLKNGVSQIRRYAPGGSVDVHYAGGDSGGYMWDAMTVDQSGKIYALPATQSGREGTIMAGHFDAAATGPVLFLPAPHEAPPSSTTGTTTTSTSTSGSTSSGSSGGGSFDAVMSLAVLGLLAAAARRRHRISPVAAPKPLSEP